MQIGANQTITVGKDRKLETGRNQTEYKGKSYRHRVGSDIVIEAANQITLKTGKAMIILKKNGDIVIQGRHLFVKSSGNIDMKAAKRANIKGTKVTGNTSAKSQTVRKK